MLRLYLCAKRDALRCAKSAPDSRQVPWVRKPDRDWLCSRQRRAVHPGRGGTGVIQPGETSAAVGPFARMALMTGVASSAAERAALWGALEATEGSVPDVLIRNSRSSLPAAESHGPAPTGRHLCPGRAHHPRRGRALPADRGLAARGFQRERAQSVFLTEKVFVSGLGTFIGYALALTFACNLYF
jgi:hypothetical protein